MTRVSIDIDQPDVYYVLSAALGDFISRQELDLENQEFFNDIDPERTAHLRDVARQLLETLEA